MPIYARLLGAYSAAANRHRSTAFPDLVEIGEYASIG
jgi:hypothetical protein